MPPRLSVHLSIKNTFIDGISTTSTGEDENEDDADIGPRPGLRRTNSDTAIWLHLADTGGDAELFDDGTESVTGLIASSRAAVAKPASPRPLDTAAAGNGGPPRGAARPWASPAAAGAARQPASRAGEPARGGDPLEKSSDAAGVLEVEEMDACFRVLEDSYPVTSCSSRFASFVGMPEGEIRLLDLVVNVEAFITRVQAVFSRAYHSGDFTASQMWLRLRRPGTSTDPGSCRLNSKIELSMDHNSRADDVSEWTMKARLHYVAKAARRPPRGAPRPRGGPAAPRGAA